MPSTHFGTCHLCEANCGIAVEHEGDRILRIRGDDDDPFSRGYICPKAVALQDLHADPDRLRRPLRRTDHGFIEIDWDEALDEAATRIADIQAKHGRDAVALYAGNPTAHSYTAVLFGLMLAQVLGTKSMFSSNSVDALPRLLTSLKLYGSQAVIPVPDIDRTAYMLILGANPAASNGSIMTAPDCARRLKAVLERGGEVVVVDPRRTETADLGSRHIFIRPAADVFFLLGLLNTLFTEQLASPGRLEAFVDGIAAVRSIARDFTPERVASITGIPAAEIRGVARAFAAAKSAVCYGRMGTCTQEFGAVTSWLIDALNIVTGNLDRPGGAMFATPAFDLAGTAAALGQSGSFGRWKSRVRGLPEFNGELPAAALADEIETPGEGQIRALITHAGNPVLSLPNGKRLARAFDQLDFMISIDIYRNETTRRAHLILPPTFGLERDHYALLFHSFAVRNTAKYSPPLFTPAAGALHDWQILTELATRILDRRTLLERAAATAVRSLVTRLGPTGILRLGLRMGPHGKGLNPLGKDDGLTFDDLKAAPHGVDLGPLEPRLPGLLATPQKRIDLAPAAFVADIDRVQAALRAFESAAPSVNGNGHANGHGHGHGHADGHGHGHGHADGHGDGHGHADGNAPLLLIGRRHLRSNNSWMHNSLRLVKGRNRCTLLLHPDDARPLGVQSGDRVRIESRVGSIEAEAEVTDTIMPGVVSLPHGWGHDDPGAQLRVASEHAGVSLNDLTDDTLVDRLSGCAHFNGVPVRIERAAPPS